jgi:hydrogenase maturation protein HypF
VSLPEARFLRIRGVVQGVGFRPFVFRLAQNHGIAGWVRNGGDGVEIHAEGDEEALDAFVRDLEAQPPPAARIASLAITAAEAGGCGHFEILESVREDRPTVRISPDLPVCPGCLTELSDPADRRQGYPYINCTCCGPRFTIVLGLPYDRPRTTMRGWPMCPDCAREYHDPLDRRFHAQPVACPVCGPGYVLESGEWRWERAEAIAEAARLLRDGRIVAVKGLGGFHLACDAANAASVLALRERKFRKEKPFAVMAKDLPVARSLIDLGGGAEALLTSTARPIVLAPARRELAGVAPGNRDLGAMLPYTPLHHLLFAAGAPDALVMTSANRSSEPIAYRDDEARERLAGLADAFLIGERPIARRVDDSVARAGVLGPVILRRARGYAPGAVARLPVAEPVLAVGADLKNTVALVVGGEAFVSQHIGDLGHYEALQAFRETIRDLLEMYAVEEDELTVIHDLHPQYASTQHALELPARARLAVQHHRAHVASVLAERGVFDERVLGVAFDGTGYGDDGAIWGGEFFIGSLLAGFERVGHLRTAVLPGGDAAAEHPVQAAAGFLAELDGLPDLTAPPFLFPERYLQAGALVAKGLRTFPTTSVGRLFDTVAALLGFTRRTTFEGQAAIWLEQLARTGSAAKPLPFPFVDCELDFRPALAAVIEARRRGDEPAAVARAFHRGLAEGIRQAVSVLGEAHGASTVVLSGGVFQNELLVEDLEALLGSTPVSIWSNREVPPNDGGISLGQAALAVGRLRNGNDLAREGAP